MTPGVFLLWSAVRQHWGAMEAMIAERFEIDRRIDLAFASMETFWSFNCDVYMLKSIAMHPDARERSYINPNRERLRLLEPHGFRLRAIIARPRNGALGQACDAMKVVLREAYPARVAGTKMHLNVHASDGEAEAAYLLDLLQPVSLAHVHRRPFPLRPAYYDRLHRMRVWCAENGIDRRQACVISGGVFEACGLRESNDIDIILDSAARRKFGAAGIKDIVPGIDLAAAGYHRTVRPVALTDDQIIGDPRYHFTMLGVRFAALPLVAETKLNGGRSKDKSDVALLNGSHASFLMVPL